jgi:(p)ppGpp synthase/HD superfamily hydrolase
MTFSPERYIAALEFAAARHRTQLVPGTDLPYVVHVVSVAAELIAVLAESRVDRPDLAVQCALLHDTDEAIEIADALGSASTLLDSRIHERIVAYARHFA